MLPSFFVIGAQKCGTTSLHHYLQAHPGIYLPEGKETKFFVDDERYAKGLDYYQSHWFSDIQPGQLVGEVDPEYIYYDYALERIGKAVDLGETRFICLFREPTSRAYSHYLQSYRRGHEELSFEEAIACEAVRISRNYKARQHFSYVDRGFYFRQVQRYLGKVDRSQMLFILSEELSNDTEKVMGRVFDFLEIDHIGREHFDQRHWSAKMPRSERLLRAIHSEGLHKKLVRLALPNAKFRERLRQKVIDINESDSVAMTMNEGTRQQLKNLYREENEKLGELIGKDLSHWQ